MTPVDLPTVLAGARALPTLPQIVPQILATLEDEQSAADTLAARINTDPTVVARLLAAANSSAFGFPMRVDSTRQAILVLGLEKVRTITLATAIIDPYRLDATGYDAHRLWLHSLGVAVCAQTVAEFVGRPPEGAFTAGLLHDIGQLLMVNVAPERYAQATQRVREHGESIAQAERAVFGFDHAEVGGRLAREWRLPPEITEGIEGHHDPEAGDFGEAGDIVHLAEVLAHALDLGDFPDNRVPELSAGACARMGIEWPQFAPRFGEIGARFACLRLALRL